MKPLSAICLGLLLFGAGILVGRHLLPKETASPPSSGVAPNPKPVLDNEPRSESSEHPRSEIEQITGLARSNLGAAEAQALGMDRSRDRSAALASIARDMADRDPEDALAWLRALRLDGDKADLPSVLASFAASHPQLAASMLDDFTDSDQRQLLVGAVARHWMRTDHVGALGWLESLPAGDAPAGAYREAIHAFAAEDPGTAVSLLNRIPSAVGVEIAPQIVSMWAKRDFDGALQWITSLENPLLLNAGLRNFLGTWAFRDPKGVAAFLADAPIMTDRTAHFQRLAGIWSREDPAAAIAWGRDIADNAARAAATRAIYRNWADNDPHAVIDCLSGEEDPRERSTIIQSVATSWSADDLDGALSWIDTLGREERALATNSAIASLSKNRRPQIAADLYDRILAAGGQEEQLAFLSDSHATIAASWARDAPWDAAVWAERLPDKQRADAYLHIAVGYVRHDLEGAAQWIDGLPAGKPRDNAVYHLMERVKHIDPHTAYEWANSSEGSDERFNAVYRTIDVWKNSDPEAAREAALAANITDAQRSRIMKWFD